MSRLWYLVLQEMSYQAMKRQGGILNEYYQEKEANLKRLHTVWFQLYDITKKIKQWRQWTDQIPGIEVRRGGMPRQSADF